MRLLPEWVKQDAIVLAWPDQHTDWAQWLSMVQETYLELITKLNANGTGIILLLRNDQMSIVKEQLPADAKLLLVEADYNDTWLRDYGFLTCQHQGVNVPVNFHFNGWGQKFDAGKDNKINEQVLAQLCRNEMLHVDIVLEGGALEINDKGHLLSTSQCLLNPQRNGDMTEADYEKVFHESLGASESTLFQNGHLEGDDTDGHIDTLVRYTPNDNLVIQTAFNKPKDSHFDGLNALKEECEIAFPDAEIFQLPLPVLLDKDLMRLPASYANYLISNGAIYFPIYLEPEDEQALHVIQHAYPEFSIVPINCRPLIQQFGSLHCISMQVPTNTLKQTIIDQIQHGISHYGQ